MATREIEIVLKDPNGEGDTTLDFFPVTADSDADLDSLIEEIREELRNQLAAIQIAVREGRFSDRPHKGKTIVPGGGNLHRFKKGEKT